MGASPKGIAASSGGSEGDCFGTREAHNVSISPEEDRDGTAGTVGTGKGGEKEGCLDPRQRAARVRQAFTF
jgi:hypothetical protein